MSDPSEDCNSCQGYEVTRDFECFRSGLEGIEKVCGKFDHYGLLYAKQIVFISNELRLIIA
jgi:hypothetical protein